MADAAVAERITGTGPKRGRWTYVSDRFNGPRWRLDGTALDLEFDDLDRSGEMRGAWVLWIGDHMHGPVDHYLDSAMSHVEEYGQEASCG